MDSSPQQKRRSSTVNSKPPVPLPNLEKLIPSEHPHPYPLPNQLNPSPLPGLFIPGTTQILFDGKPLKRYLIGEKYFDMQQPANETHSEYVRSTVAGRQLRYTLEVIQQPEKARACGAGPRSSADRRPVDPPPVIELRIFDRDTDVTMQYDAGFMLYASLESARPIAQGRIHNGPIIPVLTGVAVASAAYLDRPRPAGYFIFPDLSVRHEGWYRLKFSLFEAIKHPQDADPDRPFADALGNPEQPVVHEAMANRMEVQSTPFQVFSAKKFPGLNTSTDLSKVVAEQGCRVRIRRDIRQRKRTKADQQFTDHADEGRGSFRGTPEPAYQGLEHSRSHSRSSMDPYMSDRLRRQSVESIYGQHTQVSSRHPSITGLPTPMAAPPPPSGYNVNPRSSTDVVPPNGYTQMYRPGEINSCQPVTSIHPNVQGSSRPITPDTDHNVTLPPLTNLNKASFNSSTRLYDLPESSAAKRSSSPHTYNQETSMKSGARPDRRSQPPSSLGWILGNNGVIEPDDRADGDFSDSDDSLMNGELIYHRADGSRGNKISAMMSYYRR